MRRTMRLGVVLLVLGILPLSAFGGGNRCPPRVGTIASQIDPVTNGRAVVFIDGEDSRTYQLNTTDEATFHVGHRVKVVAHVIPETTNTLFVHSFRCLRAEESSKSRPR